MDKKPLEKKPRCPKGQTRNKQGNCVANTAKKVKIPTQVVKKTAIKSPLKKNKTIKKVKKPFLSKEQAVKLLVERQTCIQIFRDKL